MLNKSRFRFKVLLCFFSLAFVTLVLLYITGPRIPKGPSVRVLHVSFAINRIGDAGAFPIITTISNEANRSIEIDREEWDLMYESQPSYQNNIILECSATFPIYWRYEGYGAPNVQEQNVRKVDNFNDTSTYSFVSLLNLMPLKEESTGRYFCAGISDTDPVKFTYIQLFVPGERIFIIESNLSIEADISEQLVIPCPVSNPGVSPTLVFKGSIVRKDYIRSYDPAVGFVLNAKFLEQHDPLGFYYCMKERRQSGKIVISDKKGITFCFWFMFFRPKNILCLGFWFETSESTVKVEPTFSTVLFDENFDGIFKCNAKENVTLNFRRVNKLRKVVLTVNSSSNYQFHVSVGLKKSDLREGSIITCKTVRKSIELHAWKILLSESQDIQNPKFYFKMETDEYVCCGTYSNRQKLKHTSCLTPDECYIAANCVISQNCDVLRSKVREKSGCLYHKIEYEKNVASGLIPCGDDDKSEIFTYFNLKNETGLVFSDFSNQGLKTSSNNISLELMLQVEQVFIRRYGSGFKMKYKCKGPKYYFSSGFIWLIIRYNGLLDFFVGNDYFEGSWIHSHVEFEDPFDDQRQAKKIYCFAPPWNSQSEWKSVSKYISNILE